MLDLVYAVGRSFPKSVRMKIRHMAVRIGFDTTDWVRVVMYQECFAFIESIGPETIDVLEISGGNSPWRQRFNFGSYTSTTFPDFDICAKIIDRQFDLIIADQVFEHLAWPMRAGRNVYAMLRRGGYFVIATPFLIRVHEDPIDCSRWTERGLSYLLQECGFLAPDIKTGSWGNRKCLNANLSKWRKYGFYRSLANEPDLPVTVWAIARKPAETSEGR
jgi:SAM-dependent methyltransferase